MSRIIAHRGAPLTDGANWRENSMAAFRAAVKKGATWLETDVRLISDGSLILFHDDNLRRIYQRRGKTRDLTVAQAQALEIVSLRELVEAQLGVGLNLELKLNRGACEANQRALGTKVAQFLNELGAAGAATAVVPPIFISSFYPHTLAAFKQTRAEDCVGLACRRVNDAALARASHLGAVSIHSAHTAASARDITKVRAAGFESYLYAINAKKNMQPLWDAGMTGLFTYALDEFEDYL